MQHQITLGCGIVTGLLTSAATAIGAVISETFDPEAHDVHTEAMTTLVGGAIVGALASCVGFSLLNLATNETNQTSVNKCARLVEFMMSIGIILSAPLAGEFILNSGTEWDATVIDTLLGMAVMCGGAIPFACCFACCTTVAGAAYITRQAHNDFVEAPAAPRRSDLEAQHGSALQAPSFSNNVMPTLVPIHQQFATIYTQSRTQFDNDIARVFGRGFN